MGLSDAWICGVRRVRRNGEGREMSQPQAKQRHLARGATDPRRLSGQRLLQACIGFPDEMFAAIRARAERDGTSFAEQVRTFCEWGLEVE
jgi:hypothetical protein